MNTKHTPGPWRHERGMILYGETTQTDRGTCYNVIAALHGTALPNAQANARLISAAPELLAACEQHANYYDHALPDGAWTRTPMWGILAAIRAAIAKATGKE